MDERTGKSEPEVADSDKSTMTSSISDLTYFRRQVNESLMKLQQSLLSERHDGGSHVTSESLSTVADGEVCGILSIQTKLSL